MKEIFYFQHDSDAKNDIKIRSLIEMHGLHAYGLFWIILEDLSTCKNYEIDKSVITKLYHSYNSDIILKDMIDLKLFSEKNNYIFSESFKERMKKIKMQKEKQSEGGKKGMSQRWGKQSSYDDKQVISNLQGSYKQDITVNKSKLNKSKLNKSIYKEEKEIYKEKELTNKLQIFIKEKLSNVSKLKKQLTESESNTLLEKYTTEIIKDTLEKMENYKELPKKYSSVYLTLNNWIKLELERNPEKAILKSKTNKKRLPYSMETITQSSDHNYTLLDGTARYNEQNWMEYYKEKNYDLTKYIF